MHSEAISVFVAGLFFLASLRISCTVPATSPCPSSCVLPECQCAGRSIPGGLRRDQIPQIVTISFDDAIRVQDYEMFHSKVLKGRTNPNGCNVHYTFFVSHKNTDYSLAGELVSKGHELAVHSVTHRTPSEYWAGDNDNEDEITREIVDMRTILSRWAHVSKDKVVGYRTPFLASSENQLKILHKNDFLYDCTMVTNEMYWPFTLDYKSPICNSPAVCPDESYPGLWVIPNINKVQNSSFSCSMIDGCSHPFKSTYGQWMFFFKHNFERHYNTTKAPFGLYAHASWFYFPNMAERLQAFLDFLDYLGSLNDVYIVTMSQLVAWSRNPTPLSEISSFKPWQCPDIPPTNCVHGDHTLCRYGSDSEGSDGLIRLCGNDGCPPFYPNISIPTGGEPTPSTALFSERTSSITQPSTLVATSSSQPMVSSHLGGSSSHTESVATSVATSNDVSSSFATSSDVRSLTSISTSSVRSSGTSSHSGTTNVLDHTTVLSLLPSALHSPSVVYYTTESNVMPTSDSHTTSETLPTKNSGFTDTDQSPTAELNTSAIETEGPALSDSNNKSGGLEAGALAGVIIGVLLVVIVLVSMIATGVILVFWVRRTNLKPAVGFSSRPPGPIASYHNPSTHLTL